MEKYEVRLESVCCGKFDYVEHIFTSVDKAIEAVNRHVLEGFSCAGLNDADVQCAYGHVVDMSDNRIIFRKEREYP